MTSAKTVVSEVMDPLKDTGRFNWVFEYALRRTDSVIILSDTHEYAQHSAANKGSAINVVTVLSPKL